MKPGTIIAVVGTTATGKTALGVNLAKQLGGEVISADSRVVYRELDIGTAKPTEEEQQGVPHHMMDLINPDESYSVSDYQKTGLPLIEEIQSRGNIPIVVGGTGLYVRALLQESFFPDIPPDSAFRHEMAQLAEAHGMDYLHNLLAEKDPRRAAQLHPNDQVRVIRALEIIERTGQPVPTETESRPFDVCWLGLMYEDRDLMRKRIGERMEAMMAAGWVAEVQNLLEKYGAEAQGLKAAHGYPELVKMLQGDMTPEAAREQIQINTQQYARRQITWFRPNSAIQWLSPDRTPANALLEQALQKVNTHQPASPNG